MFAMWHAFSVLFRVGASLGLRRRRNPRLVCGTLSAYCLAGSKLSFYGVFVSGNIMSNALLPMSDRLRGKSLSGRIWAGNSEFFRSVFLSGMFSAITKA
ncbi:MAG: hypothetical protein GX945_00915 [Lentisphaerae bacterium]|nr:hypothetical protein [Lentisphaerota bacterium]